LSENFKRQSCSTIKSNSINILAGDDPVLSILVKFGHKGTNPEYKGCAFTFHTRRAVQSALADLLVMKCCSIDAWIIVMIRTHFRVDLA